jgi:hypothetical protein
MTGIVCFREEVKEFFLSKASKLVLVPSELRGL